MPTLTIPAKVDQAAALMRLVFEQNPDTRMTREDVEGCLDLSGFSPSTRQRALNLLVVEKVIRYEGAWLDGHAYVYWLPKEES